MNTQFTVDYFIRKFEAIPESKWNDGVQYDESNKSRCAYGHCATITCRYRANGHETPEGKALTNLLQGLLNLHWVSTGARFLKHVYDAIPARINNGDCQEYQQPTPKQRIIAALYDIKKLQQPKHTDITKELAVMPVAETSDTIKELQTYSIPPL